MVECFQQSRYHFYSCHQDNHDHRKERLFYLRLNENDGTFTPQKSCVKIQEKSAKKAT